MSVVFPTVVNVRNTQRIRLVDSSIDPSAEGSMAKRDSLQAHRYAAQVRKTIPGPGEQLNEGDSNALRCHS